PAWILVQAPRLKLELRRELPSLHDPPPAPSKHLTRCLRNRVQASGRYLLRSPFLAKLFLCVTLRADSAKCNNCCSKGDAGSYNRRKLRRRFPKSSIPKKLNCDHFSLPYYGT